MSIVDQLHADIRAVCPIIGVTIVDAQDKGTWSIFFADFATAEQRTAAQGVLTAFDAAAVQAQLEQRAARLAADRQELGENRANSAILAILDMTPAQRMELITTAFPAFNAQQRNLMMAMMTMGCMGARAQVRQ